MADDETEEKPHEPTPRRLDEMRKRGQGPAGSADFTGFFVVAVTIGGLANSVGAVTRPLVRALNEAIGAAGNDELPARGLVELSILRTAGEAVTALWPTLVAAAMAGALASFIRLLPAVGPIFTFESISPKFERLFNGDQLKRMLMLSPEGRVEFAFTVVKFLTVAGTTFAILENRLPTLLGTCGADPIAAVEATGAMAGTLVSAVLGAFGGLGFVDLLRRMRKFRVDARMSEKELKEEIKDQLGSPEVREMKHRAQAEFREQLRKMQRAPDTDLGVMNPTHYFVGLRFDPTEGAPRVWVKAEDGNALALRDIALRAGVPVKVDRELARSLYTVREGGWAPLELHDALAAVYQWARERYEDDGRTLPWEARESKPKDGASWSWDLPLAAG